MSERGFAIGRDARPLRFLLLCVGGWTVLRVAAHWAPEPPPPDAMAPPWSAPAPFAATDWSLAPPALAPKAMVPRPSRMASLPPIQVAERGGTSDAAIATADAVATGGADRHALRAALLTRLLPPSTGGTARSAMRRGAGDWFPVAVPAAAPPGQGKPFWMRRQMAGWSLGGWLYVRDDVRAVPGGIAARSQLGGSQAGLRVAYGFGDTGRTRAYGRATIAVRRPAQREVALGLALAPLAHWPVDVAIEHRLGVGREGRSALAAMVSGGVGDVALPHGFRLEAYGQAGVVGARRRDGFADGAIVIDRRLGPDEASPLRLGALAAGAVQPGAGRVDVGPRLTLRLPHVGEGSRIALDWRQRVAGDAAPESGVALTLASDF